MSTNRRTFTPEFKADAVQLVVQGRRPIAQVARELEINESSLGYWVKTYRAQHPDPETAPPAPEALRIARLEAEIIRDSILKVSGLLDSTMFGKGTLNAHAYDKAVMARLWDVSEKAVGFEWSL